MCIRDSNSSLAEPKRLKQCVSKTIHKERHSSLTISFQFYLQMSINDYKRKLDDANRSPNKKAALGSWKTSIFTIKDAATAPPIKKWIESIADGAKVMQLLAPSVAGLAYLAEGKNVQVLSLPALSTDQTKLVGHAGTDFEDNTMPCGLDINDITGNVLAIVDKPLAEQAKFVFIDTDLNAGPLVIGTGTRANSNNWDLSLIHI